MCRLVVSLVEAFGPLVLLGSTVAVLGVDQTRLESPLGCSGAICAAKRISASDQSDLD